MFPRFAPVLSGASLMICASLFAASGHTAPVSVPADRDYALSLITQASNLDEAANALPAEDIVTVPLPSAVVLFVSALAGLGLLARRRRTPKSRSAHVD
jgi:hypothetical protein